MDGEGEGLNEFSNVEISTLRTTTCFLHISLLIKEWCV